MILIRFITSSWGARGTGVLFGPTTRSMCAVAALLLVMAAVNPVPVPPAWSLPAPLIAGAILGAVNASAVCRDVTGSRYAALRYYGFSAGGFMGLFALMALPCTIIETAACLMLLVLPEGSSGPALILIVISTSATTGIFALLLCAARRERAPSHRPLLPVMRRLPADRRAALRLRYLGECRRLPAVIALAEAAFIACAMGRFGMSVAGAVHIGGALVASACVCAVGEAESTRAGRFSRKRYEVADPELVRAGAPMILIPVSVALVLTGILAAVNGGAADAPSIAAGAGYQLIAAPLLLAAMVRFSATRTVSPLAELIFLLIMLTPGLAVLAGAATLIHRRGRRRA